MTSYKKLYEMNFEKEQMINQKIAFTWIDDNIKQHVYEQTGNTFIKHWHFYSY